MNSTHELLGHMLTAQQKVNDLMAPRWRTDRYDYTLAAGFETVEMIGHNGYKWWKKETSDFPQMQLEVVDITHFLFSEIARTVNDPEKELAYLIELWDKNETSIKFDEKVYELDRLTPMEMMKLQCAMMMVGRYSFSLLRRLIEFVGMNLHQWYRVYMSKNVLNEFRQKHGDKQGTYPRMWAGREDNEYLYDLARDWDVEKDGPDVIYGKLEQAFNAFAVPGSN